MDEVTLRNIEVFGPIVVAIIGGYFVFLQTKINKRLQDLEDYVAVSIAPGLANNLLVMNVGKINLYLHKYEVGSETDNFSEPLLIPAGTNSYFQIPVKFWKNGEKNKVKLYLTDEFSEKYLSRGEVIIESFPARPIQSNIQGVQQFDTNPMQIMTNQSNLISMRAWSYKTNKYNWEI